MIDKILMGFIMIAIGIIALVMYAKDLAPALMSAVSALMAFGVGCIFLWEAYKMSHRADSS